MILPNMRRVNQSLSNEEIVDALCASSTGVLAVIGEDGYPYTVPLTYAYDAQENVFWFHSAPEGYKLDAIRHCDKASFCVVAKDEMLKDAFATDYESVIAFGHVAVFDDVETCTKALRAIGMHTAPERSEALEQCILATATKTNVIRFSIDYMTGKRASGVVREKALKEKSQ